MLLFALSRVKSDSNPEEIIRIPITVIDSQSNEPVSVSFVVHRGVDIADAAEAFALARGLGSGAAATIADRAFELAAIHGHVPHRRIVVTLVPPAIKYESVNETLARLDWLGHSLRVSGGCDLAVVVHWYSGSFNDVNGMGTPFSEADAAEVFGCSASIVALPSDEKSSFNGATITDLVDEVISSPPHSSGKISLVALVWVPPQRQRDKMGYIREAADALCPATLLEPTSISSGSIRDPTACSIWASHARAVAARFGLPAAGGYARLRRTVLVGEDLHRSPVFAVRIGIDDNGQEPYGSEHNGEGESMHEQEFIPRTLSLMENPSLVVFDAHPTVGGSWEHMIRGTLIGASNAPQSQNPLYQGASTNKHLVRKATSLGALLLSWSRRLESLGALWTDRPLSRRHIPALLHHHRRSIKPVGGTKRPKGIDIDNCGGEGDLSMAFFVLIATQGANDVTTEGCFADVARTVRLSFSFNSSSSFLFCLQKTASLI